VADQGLNGGSGRAVGFAARFAVVALAAACGSATPGAETARIGRTREAPALPYEEAPGQWGTYHSLRFRMSVPLPSRHSWKIDDHSRAELVATDPGTHSKITILSETEPSLVNHQLCEARARALGLAADNVDPASKPAQAPPVAHLQPIEDLVTVGPEAYDTRVQVAVERGSGQGKMLVGHVFAFGAYVDKCFVFHLATDVRSEEDEQTLSQRLAVARLRILAGIKVDELGSIARGKNPL
jgi:hypothetical protein